MIFAWNPYLEKRDLAISSAAMPQENSPVIINNSAIYSTSLHINSNHHILKGKADLLARNRAPMYFKVVHNCLEEGN